jgi:hypothetical protein
VNHQDELALYAEVLQEVPEPGPRTCAAPIGRCIPGSGHFHPSPNTQLDNQFYDVWARANGFTVVGDGTDGD